MHTSHFLITVLVMLIAVGLTGSGAWLCLEGGQRVIGIFLFILGVYLWFSDVGPLSGIFQQQGWGLLRYLLLLTNR